MNIQNYLLCILYLILIVIHSFTLCRKDFHRGLISVFTFALFTETTSTILETIHHLVLAYGRGATDLDLKSFYNLHYIAHLLHLTSINFFILFLLIIAKGWPITRRDVPNKYALGLFWLLCLSADLISFYWTTITTIAMRLTLTISDQSLSQTSSELMPANSSSTNLTQNDISSALSSAGTVATTTITTLTLDNAHPSNTITNLTSAFLDSLPQDQEQFNTTPRRLSLLLRVVIMLFFLLELRTTMMLEQEKRKLQFYLHFGALTMVWFVHTLIVYIISLRVDSNWQSKLISGFSSAANFLGFAVTTRLLWPKNSNSDLFRKCGANPANTALEEGCELDNLSTNNQDEGSHTDVDDDYDGLQMRDLESKN